MTARKIQLNKIEFFTKEGANANLLFPKPFSFIYGASNTGKSFAFKTMDFMLGGSRELPGISERKPYNTVALDFEIRGEKRYRLERAISGGAYRLLSAKSEERILAARHDSEDADNLSHFLLRHIGVGSSEIAKDKSGSKRQLSFRDFARLCLTDETAIQSEISPIESGDRTLTIAERNVFKFILTGEDDSALVTRLKPKEFGTSRRAQVQMIENMITAIEQELSEDFPNHDSLHEQKEEVEETLKTIEQDIISTRQSVQSMIEQKTSLIRAISLDQQRVNDIALALENFEQLKRVYESDVVRLEALEEAGFLLGKESKKSCPVCGAPPESQNHSHGISEIEDVRKAAEIEIAKIRSYQSELQTTVANAEKELEKTGARLQDNRNDLSTLELKLKESTPNADDQRQKFSEIIPRRDHLNHGLSLIKRKIQLENQKKQIEKSKQSRPKTNYQEGLTTQTGQGFADVVSEVLKAWDFPGECRVVFDHEAYDLIIDGKRRRDNGKGVRAITHAAFKVAILIFCERNKLPHPGFLVLDTPLITYRDPLTSKAGNLSPDEEALKSTDLKLKFFNHLANLGPNLQFVVFDNADPPDLNNTNISVEAFTNDAVFGRQGLL